jgi:hypothetical protein
VRHDSRLKAPQPQQGNGNHWVAGLIVMIATAVAFVGFARVSVGWTLLISTLVLFGMVAFLWAVGGGKERS